MNVPERLFVCKILYINVNIKAATMSLSLSSFKVGTKIFCDATVDLVLEFYFPKHPLTLSLALGFALSLVSISTFTHFFSTITCIAHM